MRERSRETAEAKSPAPKKKYPAPRLILFALAILVPLFSFYVIYTESGGGGFSLNTATISADKSSAYYDEETRVTGEAAPVTPGAPLMKEAAQEGGMGSDESLIAPSPGSAAERMVIRSRDIQLEVKDTSKGASEVEALTAREGGFVQNLSFTTEDVEPPIIVYAESGEAQVKSPGKSFKQAYITVKVPSKNYERFVKAIKKLGKLESESSAADEVTEQYIDLNARLDNARKTETRYQEILDDATKVEDMLKVEEQLSRIRGTIEQMEAEKKYLERSTAMATVTINLHEPKPVITPEGQDWGFVDAIREAIQGFVAMINFLIVFTGTVLPFLIVYALIYGIYRAFWKRGI